MKLIYQITILCCFILVVLSEESAEKPKKEKDDVKPEKENDVTDKPTEKPTAKPTEKPEEKKDEDKPKPKDKDVTTKKPEPTTTPESIQPYPAYPGFYYPGFQPVFRQPGFFPRQQGFQPRQLGFPLGPPTYPPPEPEPKTDVTSEKDFKPGETPLPNLVFPQGFQPIYTPFRRYNNPYQRQFPGAGPGYFLG